MSTPADAFWAVHPPAPGDRFGRHEPLPGWSWRPRLTDHDLWLVRGGRGTARLDGLAPLLRAQVGMSLREYQLESRLRRAQVLVGETDLPIAEVALLLGYVDHTLFSRASARWSAAARWRRPAARHRVPHADPGAGAADPG